MFLDSVFGRRSIIVLRARQPKSSHWVNEHDRVMASVACDGVVTKAVFTPQLWDRNGSGRQPGTRVHTCSVPEPFHCDHIARWSARSGTTGRSGTGVNTGARLRSVTVPVPKLWCEHGLRSSHSFNVKQRQHRCWKESSNCT